MVKVLQTDKTISTFDSGNNSAILLTSNATETGSSASVEEGIYFVRGQFVRVAARELFSTNIQINHHIV